MADDAVRKPRADAQRNRLHLLEVAKAAFAAKGTAASLDEIAREAGVGIGTLYRHFPTRDALVQAVYLNESQLLAAAAGQLAERLPPLQALREWMMVFVDHIATKQLMSETLKALPCGTTDLYAASTTQITAAMDALVARAVASGEIRLGIDPLDLLRAVAGVANAGAGPLWEEKAKLLVDILIAGIRIQPT